MGLKLRRLAGRAKSRLDPLTVVGQTGLVFRRGGEEFVVVLRSVQDPARVMAEKIRRALAGSPIVTDVPAGLPPITVTASLGVATCLSDVDSPENLETVAEVRSREAKNAGKNCIVPAPSEEALREWMAR